MKLTTTEEKLADVIKAKDLTAKKMFYVEENQRQVEELRSFLEPNQYHEIRERMHQNGFRTGFACLFYGGPGTGKTETAYQLARETGRDIMIVDVPQIKSKWVGDSEKNIKALFDRYRELVRKHEASAAPILLFNEADAIIGIRKQGATSAVDKMENSIQNIILQEMETLDGIMIATTNLTQNLDTAFERRFLYKIKFDKPDAAVRQRLWLSMMPTLSDTNAYILATGYDFSGGQIENISRKATINAIPEKSVVRRGRLPGAGGDRCRGPAGARRDRCTRQHDGSGRCRRGRATGRGTTSGPGRRAWASRRASCPSPCTV